MQPRYFGRRDEAARLLNSLNNFWEMERLLQTLDAELRRHLFGLVVPSETDDGDIFQG